jgi:hypothetical protein
MRLGKLARSCKASFSPSKRQATDFLSKVGALMQRHLALLLAIIVATPSYGFETDVHYGLTYWLARKAGFSAQDAKQIASADQELDEGPSVPAPWAVIHILISNSKTDYDFVRVNHFPSDAVKPDDPENREVVAGSPAATSGADDAVGDSADSRTKEAQLWKLGVALHPLQDSWSHRGTPDIPFRPVYELRPKMSYGHPCLRGGWYSHNADLTYLHQDDTIAMAEKVYSYLTDYLSHRPDLREHPAASWFDIKPRVEAFANAGSKQAKDAWFKGNPDVPFAEYGRANLISGLDLPQTETNLTSGTPNCSNVHRNIILQLKDAIVGVPTETILAIRDVLRARRVDETDADYFLYQFLKKWIVDQAFPDASKDIDERGFGYQLMEMRVPKKQGASAEDMLRSWLVEDHGLVNARGHGILALSSAHPGTATSEEKALVKFESVESAIQTVQWPDEKRTVRPYLLKRANQLGIGRNQLRHLHMGRPEYVGIFGFQRLDHDVLMVYIGKHGGGWKVDRVYWLAL